MRKASQQLALRITPEDKALAESLAKEYNVSVSELIRFALLYINNVRPALTITITPLGKVVAPAPEMPLHN